MKLSVLDQSTVVTGRSPDASIRESIALAQHCEALGYARYWLAEHHASASQAGTAPEILISAIAATTSRIRVGSAGVMLPHYSALKVAEQFRVLEAIAPGRIDLGLGRAPGSDGRTAFALNPLAETAADHFPAQVRDLLIAGLALLRIVGRWRDRPLSPHDQADRTASLGICVPRPALYRPPRITDSRSGARIEAEAPAGEFALDVNQHDHPVVLIYGVSASPRRPARSTGSWQRDYREKRGLYTTFLLRPVAVDQLAACIRAYSYETREG